MLCKVCGRHVAVCLSAPVCHKCHVKSANGRRR